MVYYDNNSDSEAGFRQLFGDAQDKEEEEEERLY